MQGAGGPAGSLGLSGARGLRALPAGAQAAAALPGGSTHLVGLHPAQRRLHLLRHLRHRVARQLALDRLVRQRVLDAAGAGQIVGGCAEVSASEMDQPAGTGRGTRHQACTAAAAAAARPASRPARLPPQPRSPDGPAPKEVGLEAGAGLRLPAHLLVLGAVALRLLHQPLQLVGAAGGWEG